MGFGTKIAEEQLAKLTSSIDNSKKSTIELQKEEYQLKAAISENNIVIRNQIKEMKASEGSMTQMSQKLGLLRKHYRDLSEEERKSAYGKNIEGQIQVIDKELKELDATIGNHQRKVGDYEGGFKKAFEGIRGSFDSLLSGDIKGALSQFSEGIDGITQTVTYLTPAIKTATTATNAETASLLLNSTASTTAATASTALAGANARETASSNAVTAATTAETTALEANVVATGQAGAASNAAAGGGMKQLLGSIKQLTIASLRFIATPLGAALMALVGIGLAAKAVWDYNSGLQESIKLTKQFTGLTGAAADSVRQQAQALSDTYGNEFQQNLQAAQKLVKNFGISYDEAFNLISKGLANGGAANEEFFSSINEYPVLFKNAGYSAEEFINLINTGFSQGVYNDKLIDGIKEADLALKEQGKATRDALVNAFGAAFTDELFLKIKAGELTTKTALIEISKQADKTKLNHQQLAQLTADVFKGAGEDAGGAAKYFGIVRQSVENLGKPLSETAQHLENLEKANVELQEAMDEALKSDSVISLQQSLELLWVKVQTAFFQVLKPIRDFYEWGWKVLGRSESLANIWNSLQRISISLREQFDRTVQVLTRLADQLGISDGQSNKFLKTLQILFDPVKQIEVALNAVANSLEFVGKAFETANTIAEITGRTIARIAIDLENLNFSSLLNFKDSFLKSADEIAQKNEKEKQNEIRRQKEVEQYREFFAENEKKRAKEYIDNEKKRITEEEKRKKAAEDAEKNQKKYAAEQKKRADEAKKNAEKAHQEEIARMQADYEYFELINDLKLEDLDTFSKEAIKRYENYLQDQYEKQLEIAEKIAGINIEDALKIDVNKRTSEQRNLVNTYLTLYKGLSESLKALDEEVYENRNNLSEKGLERQKAYALLDYLIAQSNGKLKEEVDAEYHSKIHRIEKDTLEFKYQLNEDEVKNKYLTTNELTAVETEFLKAIEELNAKYRDQQKTNIDNETKLLKTRSELDYLAAIGSNQNKLEAERKHLKEVFEINKSSLEQKYGMNTDEVLNRYQTNQELTDQEVEFLEQALDLRNEFLEKDKELWTQQLEGSIATLGQALGAEAEMLQVFNAFKAYLYEVDLENENAKLQAKLQLAANVAGAMAAIAGQESDFGKAMALTQGAINIALGITKAISEKGLFGVLEGVAIAAAGAIQIAKIANAKRPETPRFSAPQFEHGVTNSSYEGLAIKDEAGAEIHLDKSGNVKDWGTNSGAKNFHIKKGDTILPNPVSERIKDLMSHNPMPDLMMSLNLNGLLKQNNYDFERLEKKFDKLERAITRKPNKSYLDTGDNLIEVTEVNGSTHQRFIQKAGVKNNIQNDFKI